MPDSPNPAPSPATRVEGNDDDAAPRVLIADDEPLLAQALAAEVARLWPQARIEPLQHDGESALEALRDGPIAVAFLDIRMPGLTGLEVAQAIVEDWPDTRPAPLLVFVTAFEKFALEAFDRAAVDYLVKPVRPDRLAHTINRLRARLTQASTNDSVESLARRLGRFLAGKGGVDAALGREASDPRGALPPLRTIRAGVGSTVKLIPIEQVVLLQAADKYVEVIATDGRALIRQSLRELMARLDPERFVQIHRSTVVNLDHVESAHRDEQARITLRLRGRDERPAVSRVYAELFRPM